jgi:restriction system protein
VASSYWVQRQREIERQRRDAERMARAMERERQRREREALRAAAQLDKERKRRYLEGRAQEAEQYNALLAGSVKELEGLLATTLSVDDALDFESLKENPKLPRFAPGRLGQAADQPVFHSPPSLSGLRGLVPGAKAKHAQAVADAEATHAAAMEAWQQDEDQRLAALSAKKSEHDAQVRELNDHMARQHAEVDAFREAYQAGEPDAVLNYASMVLASSRYPQEFPQQHRVAYVPESRQLVVEMDLPGLAAVPENLEFRYVKSKDEITAKARPTTQRRALYASVVSQVALRTVHEIFESDRAGHLESVVFNGHVDTIDPRTGQPIRPCLITLRTTRDVFDGLDLAHVEPQACLRGLSASVSKSPAELAPVRPVLEFSMVDRRFVDEVDVLSTMDRRANLMDLTPGEFEALITNLFAKMGLETRLTQASRDGGVDCVAFDPRPIFGGKVVIQAKRYKNTVGVSAVRDLFGTMQNEGASKGILVTTSGYGKASYEFAENKPLELLSGSHLLALLEDHAGMEAKIEPPEDWVDPVADVGA